jgi:SSS family solute:Na+ symporter
MVAGFALNIYLWRFTRVAFPWYVALGSVATFAVGYGASLLTPPGRQMENADASEAINDAL